MLNIFAKESNFDFRLVLENASYNHFLYVLLVKILFLEKKGRNIYIFTLESTFPEEELVN